MANKRIRTKLTIENLHKEIPAVQRRCEEEIRYLNNLINALSKYQNHDCKNQDELLLKTYLEIQSVSEAANYLNEKGYRKSGVTGPIKFISNDVSEVITSNDKDVDRNMQLLARDIQKYYKRKIDRVKVRELIEESRTN